MCCEAEGLSADCVNIWLRLLLCTLNALAFLHGIDYSICYCFQNLGSDSNAEPPLRTAAAGFEIKCDLNTAQKKCDSQRSAGQSFRRVNCTNVRI
mmetsp:Transcript_15680/g.37247  ORF Transcript_15680/g.37247 Transcript_15680/m.37247 type:complete len:95 (+) Transcript_15680:119-403(+)